MKGEPHPIPRSGLHATRSVLDSEAEFYHYIITHFPDNIYGFIEYQSHSC